jgi:hypothetical protein
MPVTYVSGDPLLTTCDMLAIGHNAKGRTELDKLATRVRDQYPTAMSAYTRKARRGRIDPGEFFIWRQARPPLMFLCVRKSAVGATRLRYVQSILVTLARDYRLYQLRSLAIAPFANPYEYDEIKKLFDMWLRRIALQVVVYETYHAGVQADEPSN